MRKTPSGTHGSPCQCTSTLSRRHEWAERGGLRHVIPEKANYLDGGFPTNTNDRKSRLVKGGDDDPLLPSLIERLFDHPDC